MNRDQSLKNLLKKVHAQFPKFSFLCQKKRQRLLGVIVDGRLCDPLFKERIVRWANHSRTLARSGEN